MPLKKIRRDIRQLNKRIFHGNVDAYYSRYFKYRGKAYKLNTDLYFPPHSCANKTLRMGPCGELLAIGGDLEPERMILAYKKGIYPMFFKDQPILWWTSEFRCVLFPKNIHISKGAKNFIKKNQYRLTVDKAFYDVICGCKETREESTWITPERIASACKLHELGIAHSIELWLDDKLVAGHFGVAIGSYFYGESQFSRVSNAGKVAMIALCLRLEELNYSLVDGGFWPTNYLKEMGADIILRDEYLDLLDQSVRVPDIVTDWGELFENWDFRFAVEKHIIEKTKIEAV